MVIFRNVLTESGYPKIYRIFLINFDDDILQYFHCWSQSAVHRTPYENGYFYLVREITSYNMIGTLSFDYFLLISPYLHFNHFRIHLISPDTLSVSEVPPNLNILELEGVRECQGQLSIYEIRFL